MYKRGVHDIRAARRFGQTSLFQIREFVLDPRVYYGNTLVFRYYYAYILNCVFPRFYNSFLYLLRLTPLHTLFLLF